MKITIVGPPASGKTTLAGILPFLLKREMTVIHGDSYFEYDKSNFEGLSAKLHESNTWIFEHISAFTYATKANCQPDLLIAFSPTEGELLKRRAEADRDPRSTPYAISMGAVESQIKKANAQGTPVIQGSGIGDILPAVVNMLWDKDILFQKTFSVVVKAVTHCNLGCDYCYMYRKHDDTSPFTKSFFSVDSAKRLGERISEYLNSSQAKSVYLSLHGGEPLLLGAKRIHDICAAIKNSAGSVANQIQFGLQTNGTLLNNDILSVLDNHGFRVGISIDGIDANDNSHRVFHSGAPAYQSVLAGIRLAQQFPWTKGKFGGLLTVVSPDSDGAEIYKGFASLGISWIDFLLQDQTWDNPPSRNSINYLNGAFDSWVTDSSERKVRIFDTVVSAMMGNTIGSEAFGLRPISTLCIGTNGNYELLDVLRGSYKDAWKLPYSIDNSSIQAVLHSPELREMWSRKYAMADECLSCRYLFVCGGGYLPHRFSTKNGFKNPSVHCADIKAFLQHVEAEVGERFVRIPSASGITNEQFVDTL